MHRYTHDCRVLIDCVSLHSYMYHKLAISSSRYNLAAGTSEKIQLGALLAAFQIVRDLVVEQAMA